jgi:hypothetical protein
MLEIKARNNNFWFSLFFIQKNKQTDLKKKNRNEGYFRAKIKTQPISLVFFCLDQFFSIWLSFFFGLVWFFDFRLIKPKPNRISWFFKYFNSFFFTIQFFQ